MNIISNIKNNIAKPESLKGKSGFSIQSSDGGIIEFVGFKTFKNSSTKGQFSVIKSETRENFVHGDFVKIIISPNVKIKDIYEKVIVYNPSQSLNIKNKFLSRRRRVFLREPVTRQNSKVEVIPSKIIEITPSIVVFECITDVKNQCFETRELPTILFEKYSYLKAGLVFHLNISQTASNLSLYISHVGDKSIEKLFDTSNLFDELEGFENVHYQ